MTLEALAQKLAEEWVAKFQWLEHEGSNREQCEQSYIAGATEKKIIAMVRDQAFSEAAHEVYKWRDLLELDHRSKIKDGVLANPQESGREYRNNDNLLGAVESGLKKLAIEAKKKAEEV